MITQFLLQIIFIFTVAAQVAGGSCLFDANRQVNAVAHPVQTVKAIYQDIKDKAGTSQGRGELFFDVATSLFSYLKVGKAAKIANAVDNVSDGASTAKNLAKTGKQVCETQGSCFTAGTQIVVGVIYDEELCTIEYVTANIENIKVGDYVLAQNVETGEVSLKEVTSALQRTSDHIRYLTTIDEEGDEQIIETTDSHPVWVVTDSPDLSRAARGTVVDNGTTLVHENLAVTANGYYVEAKDLCVGDVFVGANGELTTLATTNRVEYPNGITVYNFTVADNHNYFIVANLEAYQNGASVVLVHNAACGVGYRVMTSEEYVGASQGIWSDSKLVVGDLGEMGSKWFWDNKDSALMWKQFCDANGDIKQIITKVEIDKTISSYPSFPHGIEGKAYHIPIIDLGRAKRVM